MNLNFDDELMALPVFIVAVVWMGEILVAVGIVLVG
jgi:hypothetical protein